MNVRVSVGADISIKPGREPQGSGSGTRVEPARQATAFTLDVAPFESAVTRAAGLALVDPILGLTPQALC